ncbi:MAG: response regulator [Magnetococcales bacterium]|nr:response regulator [Magnetococcales bacterium]
MSVVQDVPVPVLLIEDDLPFGLLLSEWLDESNRDDALVGGVSRLQLESVPTLALAIRRLERGDVAAVVVDLNLPDSQGMATFDQLQEVCPHIPIVVLSGINDGSIALQAMRRGAQDYLIKAHVTGLLLSRAVRYAIERHNLQQELLRIQGSARREQERQFLDRFTHRSAVSASMLGVPSLRQGLPDLFQNFIDRFDDVLERAMEQRSYKVSQVEYISDVLLVLARDLSFLKCGPRDVIDIYMEALSRKDGLFNPIKTQAYSEEGRLLSLELMGQLVLQYRPYALGTGRNYSGVE